MKFSDTVETIYKEVRSGEEFGRGSCTYIDECFSDEELKKEISEMVDEGYNMLQMLKIWRKVASVHAEREMY